MSGFSTLGQTRPADGSESMRAFKVSMQPPSTTISEFMRQTNFPALAMMPMLLALANPRFSSDLMSLTSGKSSSTASAEPSDEPLSTTIISAQGGSSSYRDMRQPIRYSLAFQLTIIIDTSGIRPRLP